MSDYGNDDKHNAANYFEDKVLIQFANTQQTQDMEVYTLYSDEYSSINNHFYELQSTNESDIVKIAESTDVIKSELNLGVEFSEMKLLNPAINKSEHGLYSIEDGSNDCNNIFSLTLENITVGEALEILNDNPAI